MTSRQDAQPTVEPVLGCLLGTAYGDALGLPYEGVSAQRAARLLGPPDRFRLLAGRGMLSDDTEHSLMVALALNESTFDPDRFAKRLAAHLRLWFLALPAGLGMATLRSGLKLCVGFPPHRSGVYSAGNGPAMRAPLLGVVAEDPVHLDKLVTASTVLTHTDPKACAGAKAVAFATYLGVRDDLTDREALADRFIEAVNSHISEGGETLLPLLSKAAESAAAGQSTEQFAADIGLAKGISGYIEHTVPVCVHAWLAFRHQLQDAVQATVKLGGDADTTAAIVGGMCGVLAAREDPTAFARLKLDQVVDWPWSLARIRALAAALVSARRACLSVPAPRPLWLLRLPRNIIFLLIVLVHGLRRLLPPY
ncbi:MAG: ADP-ribosylglycohydrolase family protein [Pseudomonadota bacterium]